MEHGTGQTHEVATEAVRAHYAELAATYDRRANRACMQAYRELLTRCLGGAARVLELGAGASSVLPSGAFHVALDLSVPMLHARLAASDSVCAAADAQCIPCPADSFDAVFCINLLEHVPDPAAVLAEAARVLHPGGVFVGVTPNGDLERLLDVLERLHLKLPEGPHQFLTYQDMADAVASRFDIIEHQRFLACPAGPDAFVRGIDHLLGRWGLFQYVFLKKSCTP